MKKTTILSLLLFAMLGANAQEWRGFLELTAGTSPGKSDIAYANSVVPDVTNPFSFGLNYTMGIKVLPQFYAGIGMGGYTSLTYYKEVVSNTDHINGDVYSYTESVFTSIYFPIFADFRWIPDISRKINPFVDLKIGYQMGVDLEGAKLYEYSYSNNTEYYARHNNGLVLQPGVGIRFGRDSAFNLGIAYNVTIGRKFTATHVTSPGMTVMESVNKNYSCIMLTFGADF